MTRTYNPVNSNEERAARIANATPAEREAARQSYIAYAKANRAIGSPPEPFPKFLAEYLDCAKVRLPADPEPDQHEKRDYSTIYKGGEK